MWAWRFGRIAVLLGSRWFFWVWVVGLVFFFPLRDLGKQAFFFFMFLSTFLRFCAWETEVERSICCCLCLEMGHEGDFSLIQYVPSCEPLQLTCLPPFPRLRALAEPAGCCNDKSFIRKMIIASGEH